MLGKQISLKDMESVVRFLLHYRASDFGSVKYLFFELALLKQIHIFLLSFLWNSFTLMKSNSSFSQVKANEFFNFLCV